MFLKLARLAIHNLLRARARLAMTSGGVLVGTTAVILLIALTNGLQQAAENGIGQSGSLTEIMVMPSFDAPSATRTIPRLTAETVRGFNTIPGVALVVPLLNLQVQSELRAGNLTGFAQFTGLDPRLIPFMELTSNGLPVTLEPGEILLGSQIVNNFYDLTAEEFEVFTVDVANTPVEVRLTDSTGAVRRLDVRSSTVLDANSNFDFTVILPIAIVNELNMRANSDNETTEPFAFDTVLVRARDREVTNEVSSAISELGFQVSGIGDFINQINGFFNTLRLALGGVGGVALLVAAFGVANTMTMAILERTREIGLMKAIGASDQDVLTIFLVEAALVGLLGGAAGVGLSLIVQEAVNRALASAPAGDGAGGGMGGFLPFDLSQTGGTLLVITTELMVLGVLLATTVGIVAGLFPALRAARMLTVTALKTQ